MMWIGLAIVFGSFGIIDLIISIKHSRYDNYDKSIRAELQSTLYFIAALICLK